MLLEDGQRPKDVLLDHVDDQVEMRNDYRGHAVLIIEVIIELLKVGLPVILLLDLLAIVIEVQRIRAGLQLFQKLIPVLLMRTT